MSHVYPGHFSRTHHVSNTRKNRHRGQQPSKADRKAAKLSQKMRQEHARRVAKKKTFHAEPPKSSGIEDLQLQVAVLLPTIYRIAN